MGLGGLTLHPTGWRSLFASVRSRLTGNGAPTIPPWAAPGFDWRTYVERYPDLKEGGVDSEEKALAHWVYFGREEGRSYGPASYPTKRAMGCASVDSLYLRASGALVCWDDAGGDLVLQPFDESVHYGRDVYLGPVFNSIRRKLYEDDIPFPEVCRRCIHFRCRTDHSAVPVDDRVVRIFEIEPSVNCHLECPGCFDLERRRAIPGTRTLRRPVLVKVLDDLRDAGMRVRAFDFQGHGEPLICPNLSELIRAVRERFPSSFITMCTSANGPLRPGLLASGLDEVVCSIDGVDPASYAYRVHGDFHRAMGFLRSLAEARQSEAPRLKIIWKYILLDMNSSKEMLLRAQSLASEIGVDELAFVFTRNGPRSRTVTRDEDVPRLPGGPPLRFHHHEPSLGNLRDELALAENLLAQADSRRAVNVLWAASSMLGRFFSRREDLTPAHAEIVDELARQAARLSSDERAKVLSSVKPLLS